MATPLRTKASVLTEKKLKTTTSSVVKKPAVKERAKSNVSATTSPKRTPRAKAATVPKPKKILRVRTPLTEEKINLISRLAPTKSYASTAKKATVKSSTKEEVVLITGSPSVRLQEKFALYQLWYQKNSDHYMRHVARVSGYIFIFTGLAAASLTAVSFPQNNSGFSLSSCVTQECLLQHTAEVSGALANLEQPDTSKSPRVDFPETVAISSDVDTNLTLSAVDTAAVELTLEAKMTGSIITLDTQPTADANQYSVTIPSASLPEDEYTTKAVARYTDLSATAIFSGPTFKIERSKPQIVPEVAAEHTTETMGDTASTSTEPDSISTDAGQATSTTVTLENETSSTSKDTAQSLSPTPLLTVTQTEENSQGMSKIKIAPVYAYERIELYLRKDHAIQKQYLGQATQATDGWYFWFDSTKIPTGTYVVFVEAKVGEETVAEASLPYVQITTATPYLLGVKNSISTSSSIAATTTTENGSSPRTIDYTDQTFRSAPDNPAEKVVFSLLEANSAQLNDLLQRYGSALATNDPELLRLADSSWKEFTDTLLVTALQSIDGMRSDVTTVLENEIQRLTQKVELTQLLMAERGGSALDSDGDGISDRDEETLYGTDPQAADSDQDGVIDGVEIMLGYNAAQATAETVLRYESPQTTHYERNDIIGIYSIKPVFEIFGGPEEKSAMYAEISGHSLANSFVTLFMYSQPTIVTVKTDEAGLFTYRYDKDLALGEHKVYAALTDNTGSIVVQSSAFIFTKTAEGIVSKKTNGNLDFSAAAAESGISFSRVANMSISLTLVSFGFILLLLGSTLARRKGKTRDATLPV